MFYKKKIGKLAISNQNIFDGIFYAIKARVGYLKVQNINYKIAHRTHHYLKT